MHILMCVYVLTACTVWVCDRFQETNQVTKIAFHYIKVLRFNFLQPIVSDMKGKEQGGLAYEVLLCNSKLSFILCRVAVQKVLEFIQSRKSQAQAVVLLSEQETNMAPCCRRTTQGTASASRKHRPVVIWVRRESWRRRWS